MSHMHSRYGLSAYILYLFEIILNSFYDLKSYHELSSNLIIW